MKFFISFAFRLLKKQLRVIAWLLLLCNMEQARAQSSQGLVASPPMGEYTFAEKGDAVFRDAYPSTSKAPAYLHYDHTGIFLGRNHLTGDKAFINAPGYQLQLDFHPIIDQPVVVTDFKGFLTDRTGVNAFLGIRDHALTWKQRDQIVDAALAQQGCLYSLFFVIKHPSTTRVSSDHSPYYYLTHATNADGYFRCDGLVEYAYEVAGAGLFSSFERNPVSMTPRSLMDRMSPVLVRPPQASSFFPTSGATVSGVSKVECYLTDQDWGSGVEKADFYLPQGNVFQQVSDNHQVDVSGVYSVTWDTTQVVDGSHTLFVTCYDQAGNWKTYLWQVNVHNGSAGGGSGGGTDSAKYVSEGTPVDNTVFNPGRGFSKSWTILNNGTSIWGPGYRWTFDGGDQMSGPASINAPTVAPNHTWSPSINLVAPAARTSSYRGYWRMQAPNGKKFGTQPWVQIKVAESTDLTRPNGYIDTFYQQNLTASGTVRVAGWADDGHGTSSGLRSVQLLLDGKDMGAVAYPETRADGQRGFHLDWDTRSTSNGSHTVTLHLVSNAGVTFDLSRTVLVSNAVGIGPAPPEPTPPNPTPPPVGTGPTPPGQPVPGQPTPVPSGFTLTATTTPEAIAPGSTVTIQVTVSDNGVVLNDGIVNVEVFDSTGTRVGQKFFEQQSFAIGDSRLFTMAWTAPTTQSIYTVKAGIFDHPVGEQWGNKLAWNDQAATIIPAIPASFMYDFEADVQGWTSSGGMITGASSSTVRAFTALHALAVNIQATAADNQRVFVTSPGVAAGKTVTFHVWIPAGSTVTAVQPYVQQGASGNWTWTGTETPISNLKLGTWTTLTVIVPLNATTPLHQLGIEFKTSASWSGTCYLDTISW